MDKIENEANDHVVTAMAMLVSRLNDKIDISGMNSDEIDLMTRQHHDEAIYTITKWAGNLYDGPVCSMAEDCNPKSYKEVFNGATHTEMMFNTRGKK